VEATGEPTALVALREHRLVAAIRARSAAEALGAAKAVAHGGIKLLEITFTVPDAVRVMEELASEPDVIIGAGTVLTREQAHAALAAGARFIIAPNHSRDVAEVALAAGVLYCPGAYTTTEILAARDMGAHVIKLYPVGVAGGPQYVRVIRDPLPDVPLLAAGGTSLENMLPFLMAGCIGIGLGGALCDPALVAAGNWSELTARSRNFAQRLAQAHTTGMLAKVDA
jgi:2-dehydro-3-deoxyphosphogluconate aldolase/(4S)-4-hydroxy-2-oxoglutarate aldolase